MVVDKSDARVRQMFAEISGNYDRMNHLLSLNVDRYWRWRTVRVVPPQGSAPILDVCTGTGDLAFAYWKAAGGNASVVGTDFCAEMLRISEQKKCRLGVDGAVQFIEADTQALPFENDTFQIVCVAFGLRNVSDTDHGLYEMVRVCQAGGHVVILEFSQPQWPPLKSAYGLYFHHVLPRVGQWLATNRHSAYNYLPESVGEFPTGHALTQRMQSAGLADVEFRPLTLGIATLYVGKK